MAFTYLFGDGQVEVSFESIPAAERLYMELVFLQILLKIDISNQVVRRSPPQTDGGVFRQV